MTNQPREVVADALPELPKAKELVYPFEMPTVSVYGYTADQMREYARAAIAATQPGASAGGEERARELLAEAYRNDGYPEAAERVEEGMGSGTVLRCIAAALRTPAKTEGEAGSA